MIRTTKELLSRFRQVIDEWRDEDLAVQLSEFEIKEHLKKKNLPPSNGSSHTFETAALSFILNLVSKVDECNSDRMLRAWILVECNRLNNLYDMEHEKEVEDVDEFA